MPGKGLGQIRSFIMNSFPPDTVDTTSLETRAMTSSDGLVCYRSPSVNMIWKTTPVVMENDGHISMEEIDEMRK